MRRALCRIRTSNQPSSRSACSPRRPSSPRGRASSRQMPRSCARRRARITCASGRSSRRHELKWHTPFTQPFDDSEAPNYRWFSDGRLNASYNCLDVPPRQRADDKTAVIFEGEPGDVRRLSYRELHAEVCRFANALKAHGRRQRRPRHHLHAAGSRDPRSPCRPATASARSTRWCSVASRRRRCRTASRTPGAHGDHRRRRLARRPGDRAQGSRRQGAQLRLRQRGARHRAEAHRQADHHAARTRRVVARRHRGQAASCEPEWVDAEHPLFLLYTSGSTGKPKGVQHATGGYLLGAKLTTQWVFDLRDDDVFWCTADVGWVTGHSYVAYGPLADGCDGADVRGCADGSGRRALLEELPEPRRHDVLHRADRDPRAHEARRRAADEVRPVAAAAAGHCRRADQPRSVDVVSPRDRRRPLPDRRHLVADRDRRHHDLAAAGRDGHQARLVHAAAAGHRGRHRRRSRPYRRTPPMQAGIS